MERYETVTLTNMCMISDENGALLVEDRIDPGWPGLVFPGGHVEKGESFVESVIREVREETGLTIASPRLCGVKQFMNGDSRYIVFLFKATRFSGEIVSSPEGPVFWVKREDLKNYRLTTGFLDVLKVFDSDDLSEFYFDHEGDRWTPVLR